MGARGEQMRRARGCADRLYSPPSPLRAMIARQADTMSGLHAGPTLFTELTSRRADEATTATRCGQGRRDRRTVPHAGPSSWDRGPAGLVLGGGYDGWRMAR